MILSEIRISLFLFQDSISTEDLLVKIDYCLDCYEQSLNQNSSTILTSTTIRSY